MHQRRNGSAAQKKMQHGNIFFEKAVTASSLPPHSQLVMPALFVQQHGDKMNKVVTLINVESNRKWPVEMNILFPQKRTQVLLYYGWRAFTVANHLAIGDRLTFVLVAQSVFDVYILRRGRSSVEKPKNCSQEPRSARRKTNPETKLCPSGPQLSRDIPTNGCEGTKTLVTKETAKETRVAVREVAVEAPDSSQNPSGMNSHFFEPPMIPPAEHDCIVCQIAAMTKLGMMKAGFHLAFNE